jgi:hypothetical protein
MPTQILDNFQVNVAKPIDNRFVVGSQSFYQNKEQIPFRYLGLRIWDLNDNFPYVWTGATWSNENQSGSVIGSGAPGFLPKFFGSNPTSNIVVSNIFDNGTNVGIGITSPIDKLHVVGNIRTTSNFIGNGSLITALNASEILSGSLSLNRITSGVAGQIMVRGSSNAEFVNSSSVSVGSSTSASISDDTSTSTAQHLTFVNGTSGNLGLKVSSNKLTFQPNNGVLNIEGSLRIGTLANKATIQYTTNTARTLTIPNVDGNRTFAFIDQAQTFTSTQFIQTSSTVVSFRVDRTNSGSHYVYITTIGANPVGLFLQNNSGQRSLYMDGTGDFITGGGTSFNNFKVDNLSTRPSGARVYFRDSVGIDTETFSFTSPIQQAFKNDTAAGQWNNSTGSFTVKLNVNGAVRSSGFFITSDRRVKDNIDYIENIGLDKILNLKPCSFNLKESGIRTSGFIAQEVMSVIPESITIHEDDNFKDGKYVLDYNAIVPYLVDSIKELKREIDELKKVN